MINLHLDKPPMMIDPEVGAERIAVFQTLSRAVNHAKDGEIQLAKNMFADFEEKHPSAQIDSEIWNKLCWYGALNGHGPEVLDACEKAIQLAPISDRPNYRDSRGVARVLSHDYSGAIEDFESFVAWAKKGQHVNKEIWLKRERGLRS